LHLKTLPHVSIGQMDTPFRVEHCFPQGRRQVAFSHQHQLRAFIYWVGYCSVSYKISTLQRQGEVMHFCNPSRRIRSSRPAWTT
jgi:hypothetical protein